MKTQDELVQQKRFKRSGDDFKMPQTKTDAFLEEFPFVRERKYVEGPIEQVYVSGLEPSFINHETELVYWCELERDGNEKHFCADQEVYLLTEDGTLVKTMKTVELGPRKKYIFFGESKMVYSENVVGGKFFTCEKTLGQVIAELGPTDTKYVRQILSYHAYTRAVIIYKIPDNKSLPEWIDLQVKKERKLFQEQIAELKKPVEA